QNDATRPFWWPDGSRLGFVGTFGTVWSVSRAGGAPEPLQEGLNQAPALSPDGRTLATWARGLKAGVPTISVWLASPPNATPREYVPAPFETKSWSTPAYLQFSPDGRQLLLSTWSDSGDAAIWLLPFPKDGSEPRRLFPKTPRIGQQVDPAQFSWMPDSRRVLIAFPTASAPNG